MRAPTLPRPIGLLIAAAVLAATPAAQAQWKWKDAQGQVHISDLPPPREVPDKDVLQRPSIKSKPVASTAAAPASGASGPDKARVDPELQAKRGRAEQAQKDKARADDERLAAQRAENCQRARQQLATLDSGIRIARVNAEGQREFLDDNARAAEAARAQQIIASDCR